MTKHIDVPRCRSWKKTVEGAQLQIVDSLFQQSSTVDLETQTHLAGSRVMAIASRIPAILKCNTETGGDPFVKVKSLITELINQLQDTSERLNKNQLTENDELEFGQACDSEHFEI